MELHFPLVRKVARRYARNGDLEDLIQVGAIGLLEAIERFDTARGADLAAFAMPTISGEIKNHLRDRAAPIRVPRRLVEATARLRAPRERLRNRLEREPTPSELASEAGMSGEDVADALRSALARTPLSLPETDGSQHRETRVDDVFAMCDDRLALGAAFRTLRARERRILHLSFFVGLSQREIARELGLSQIQVSRLIRGSLERLRRVVDVP